MESLRCATDRAPTAWLAPVVRVWQTPQANSHRRDGAANSRTSPRQPQPARPAPRPRRLTMDFEQAIRILKEAQGDTAQLGLASVDLLLVGHPDEEREKVRTALEVAAMPHWFDEEILAALLDPPLAADAEALAARLRRLPVVEPFPARGPGAANVHGGTPLALHSAL